LYNIGITADRLRMDREALEAFELFLAHVPDHPKRRETEVRVAVLRRTIEQSGAPVADAAEASETESPGDGGAPPGTAGGGRTNVVPFVGAAALGIEQRTPNGLAVGVYGGLGLAAIAGAVLWLVVGTAGDDERPSASVRGHALDLGWSF
jgi:hypothetical protein